MVWRWITEKQSWGQQKKNRAASVRNLVVAFGNIREEKIFCKLLHAAKLMPRHIHIQRKMLQEDRSYNYTRCSFFKSKEIASVIQSLANCISFVSRYWVSRRSLRRWHDVGKAWLACESSCWTSFASIVVAETTTQRSQNLPSSMPWSANILFHTEFYRFDFDFLGLNCSGFLYNGKLDEFHTWQETL